jgi:hypothetical protein
MIFGPSRPLNLLPLLGQLWSEFRHGATLDVTAMGCEYSGCRSGCSRQNLFPQGPIAAQPSKTAKAGASAVVNGSNKTWASPPSGIAIYRR